jgi:hypothetical protein
MDQSQDWLLQRKIPVADKPRHWQLQVGKLRTQETAQLTLPILIKILAEGWIVIVQPPSLYFFA